jgi:RPA family protein
MKLPAYKVTIGEILDGKYIKSPGQLEPNSLVLSGERKVSRVRIMGTVVDVYSSAQKAYSSVVVDDSTGEIRCKCYGEDIHMLDDVEKGDIIDAVGRPREGEDGITLNLELVLLADDPNLELLRKLEIILIRNRIPKTERPQETEGENSLVIEDSVIGGK